MVITQIYILIVIVSLAVVAITAVLITGKKHKPISKLGALSFSLVIAGIIFNNDRLIGYGLISAGLILSVIDIIKKSK